MCVCVWGYASISGSGVCCEETGPNFSVSVEFVCFFFLSVSRKEVHDLHEEGHVRQSKAPEKQLNPPGGKILSFISAFWNDDRLVSGVFEVIHEQESLTASGETLSAVCCLLFIIFSG